LYNKVSNNIFSKVKDYKNKSKNLALEPDLTLIMAQSRYITRTWFLKDKDYRSKILALEPDLTFIMAQSSYSTKIWF
jgi:hypothetical protein